MSNGNAKTTMRRMPVEWLELLNSVIRKIEENGFPEKVFDTEIVRLLVHFNPARKHLNKALEEIIQGFQGVQKLNPEVERWMRGHAKAITA